MKRNPPPRELECADTWDAIFVGLFFVAFVALVAFVVFLGVAFNLLVGPR